MIKKFLKTNYEFLLAIILLLLILVVAINPKAYINATFKGFSIWAKIVLPSLFCFFIFTKLLMQNKKTITIFNFLNKPFEKIFNTPHVGGYIFLMSAISGYPIGAKLTSEFYENKTITKTEAFRISCYASTSGPMFIIGSVAISLFNNLKLGIIVLIVHLLSSLIVGLIFRNYEIDKKYTFKTFLKSLFTKSNDISHNKKLAILPQPKQNLNDIMYNTIIAVVMVGGYIALCFSILEFLNYLKLLKTFGAIFNAFLPQNAKVGESLIKGILELTNGCVSLSCGNFSLKALCCSLSFLTSFGGFSIHLQSFLFLNKCGIKYKYFLLTKVLHSTIAFLLSVVFSAVLL